MALQSQFAQTADSFRFSDLVRVAAARLGLILAVATSFVAFVVVALVLWPSSYTASTTIMLVPHNNNIAEDTSALSALPADPASIQNQIQILTSRDLAANVIARLKLYEDPEFAKAETFTGEYPSADAVIDNFLKHVTVEAAVLSTTIVVSVKSLEPAKSARIADAIADAYLADEAQYQNGATDKQTAWLTTRISALAQQVQTDEARVQQYKAQNNINEIGDGTSLLDQQLTAVNAALVQAKSDLAQKQATYNHINTMIKAGQVADVSQVVASPLMIQLRTQEADVLRQEAQMANRYGPRNPKWLDIESQKQNLEDKVVEEATRIGGSVANDVTVSRAQVGSLTASLRNIEHQAMAQNLASVKLKALEADAVSTRTMYEAFVSRLRQTQGAAQEPDARIISRAEVPVVPSSPKRTLIAAASIPAGLLIGLLFALLAERATPAYPPQIVRDIRQPAYAAAPLSDPLRGLPVLGEIPDYPSLRAADLILDRPGEDYARSVDRILARIAPQRGRGKIVALTAPDRGEGKTALAMSLARDAAKRGLRTIVIDADLQWPKVAFAAGVGSLPSGLQDVLSGAAPLSQSMASDPRSAVKILSPAYSRTSIAALPAQGLSDLIAYLRQACDLVIIDCAPAIGDTRQFLALADATLMLVRWQATPRADVSQALDMLSAMHAPPTGIVFAR